MLLGFYCRYTFEALPYFLIVGILLAEKCSTVAKMSCKHKSVDATRRSNDEVRYFVNTWAVRILGGVNEAKRVAKSVGQHFYMKVSNDLPDIYLFRDPKFPERMNYSSESVTRRLKKNSKVSWAEQQVGEVRVTRRHTVTKTRSVTEPDEFSWSDTPETYVCPNSQHPHDQHTSALNLNDPFWPKQYYIMNFEEYINLHLGLQKDCRTDHADRAPADLNIAPVWVKHRLFGKNIRVLIVDDGIETKHLDLVDNYDRKLGLDLQDNDDSPDPVHSLRKKYSHGTRMAGVVGMRGNNTVCGIGIAPLVTLGAVRLLGPKFPSDYKTCSALVFGLSRVHILSNAWGPLDDGKSMPALGYLTTTALKLGISKGRQGLGFIYLFGAGNGKEVGDHCGCDVLVCSIYTIAVASNDPDGKLTSFSERCASIMVTAYSGTKGNKQYNVVATDVGGDKCTTDLVGTSTSVAMVSGALALALEANPKLSWRDVQHLLAWTSQVAPLQHNPPGTWIKNGAGFYVSHDFGFGMLNVNYLIEKAKLFQSVGTMRSCTTDTTFTPVGEVFGGSLRLEMVTNACKGSPYEVQYLEHVQLTVSLNFPKRGDLQIRLISPSGTNVTLLDKRPLDSYQFGIQFWKFDSVMTWGETPKGKWVVHITGDKRQKSVPARPRSSFKRFWSYYVKNKRRGNVSDLCTENANVSDNGIRIGELTHLSLTFHGTSGRQEPDHYKAGPRTYDDFKLSLL